jgi:predicted MFS family arabinose efflux permease
MRVLLSVALLDELSSGVAPNGSPDLLHEFHLSFAVAAGWTLLAMQLLGALEAPLFALTARWPRRSLLAASQLAMAVTCLCAAASSSVWTLLVALLCYGPCTGIACGTAQSALVDGATGNPERVLSRWALYQSVGDLGAPLLLAGLALVGPGWRAAFVVAAAMALVQAALVRAGPDLPQAMPIAEEDGRLATRGSMRSAIFWCGAGVLCTLMDETLVSFGALHLDSLGATSAQRGLLLAGSTLSAIGALMVVGRVSSRLSGMQLLLGSSAACAAVFGACLMTSSLPLGAALLALTFAFAAPLHPVVSAQAYAALPGRSTAVNVISSLFATVELSIPLALGAIANRFGVRAALAAMILEPVALVAVAAGALLRVRSGKRSRRPRTGRRNGR